MFSAGDKIVYPMHGAGFICGVEEMKILGEKKKYYIFKLPCSEINVMIPVDSETSVGIRPVADGPVQRPPPSQVPHRRNRFLWI